MSTRNADVTGWDKRIVRKWWKEVGAIKVPGETTISLKEGMDTPTSIIVAYLLAHGLPVGPMRFVNREPSTLMLKDIALGPGNRAFQVIEDPFWDDEKKVWAWKQARIYAPVTSCNGRANRPHWVTESDGWKIVTLALARRKGAENRDVNHAREMMAKAVRVGEPQEWAGRIITPEWIQRNSHGLSGGALIEHLTELALYGHSDL